MDEEEREHEIIPPGALSPIDRAEIDIQIATANRYPRSIEKFKKLALSMATLDEETAMSMFYVLPRGGKKIEGPGVRLAEVVASAWGNLRIAARPGNIGQDTLHAQGMVFDLERNVACTVEVSRRITGRGGRYDEDMMNVTMMAALSVAIRNATFKVVPFAFVKDIYEAAKAVAIGTNIPLTEQRQRALTFFSKVGGSEADVLALCRKPSVQDLDVADMTMLYGLRTAIVEGTTTLERALKEVAAAPVTVPVDGLNNVINGAKVSGINNAPPGSNAPTAEEAAARTATNGAPKPEPVAAAPQMDLGKF